VIQDLPIRVTITQPANGIRLAGGFARAEGLKVAAPQPELRFVQMYDGREVVLHDGVLQGEGFETWLRIMKEGGAVTSVEVVFEEGDRRLHAPEAWLDRIAAPEWRRDAAEIRVARLELSCDMLRP
jgi:hypothetical protein